MLNRDEAVIQLVECVADYTANLREVLSLQASLIDAIYVQSDNKKISSILSAQAEKMTAMLPKLALLEDFLVSMEPEYLKLVKPSKH